MEQQKQQSTQEDIDLKNFLANNEAKQDLMCSECGLHKKEYSNYCKPCWDSKMQN